MAILTTVGSTFLAICQSDSELSLREFANHGAILCSILMSSQSTFSTNTLLLQNTNTLLFEGTHIGFQEERFSCTFHSILDRCGPYLTEMNFFNPSKLIVDISPDFGQILMAKAPNLGLLNLNHTSALQPGSLVEIFKHPKLQKLFLTGAKFTSELADDWLVTPDFRNQSLAELNLNKTPIVDRQLELVVQQCPNLQALHLFQCTKILDFSPVSHLPKLIKLNVTFTRVTPANLVSICSGCPLLTTLKFDHCFHLQQFNLFNLTQLQVLSACGIKGCNDAILVHLAQFGNLINVRLAGCDVGDQGVMALGRGCPDLVQLNISRTRGTDTGVVVVLEQCSELELLDCSHLRLSEHVLSAIGWKAPQLMVFLAKFCEFFTETGLQLLVRGHPEMTQRRAVREKHKLELLELILDLTPSAEILEDLKEVNVRIRRKYNY